MSAPSGEPSTTQATATVIAGDRSRTTRVLFGLLGVVGMWLVSLLPRALAHETYAVLIAGYFPPFIAPLLFGLEGPPRARWSTLSIEPGLVRERRWLGLTLRARDVLGMTTCAHADGYALSVQVKTSAAPHTILVRDLETLERVRASLGGGSDGTGAVSWPTERPARERTLLTVTLVGAAVFVFGFVSMVGSLLWPVFRAFPKRAELGPSISLREHAVVWKTHLEVIFPYAQIARVTYLAASKQLAIVSNAGQRVQIDLRGVEPDQARVLASQIMGAARRARGERTMKESVVERLPWLRRAAGEPIRAWLSRLEAVAASLGGSDYRAVSVSLDDLLRIAEDPDESFEVRAGVARVIQKALGPEGRVRVSAALANVRAPERRVRVALLEDVDAAADAITQENEEEHARASGFERRSQGDGRIAR